MISSWATKKEGTSYNHQKRKSDVDEFDRTMRSTLDAAPPSVH